MLPLYKHYLLYEYIHFFLLLSIWSKRPITLIELETKIVKVPLEFWLSSLYI